MQDSPAELAFWIRRCLKAASPGAGNFPAGETIEKRKTSEKEKSSGSYFFTSATENEKKGPKKYFRKVKETKFSLAKDAPFVYDRWVVLWDWIKFKGEKYV